MGLMTGTGPLGLAAAGTWNFDPPAPGSAVYIEPTWKRVRAELEGQAVADSSHALLLSESGRQPVYYFPRRDVRLDLLTNSARRTEDPYKGTAAYFDARIGDRLENDVAWCYPQPLDGARALTGHLAFDFHRMDRWFEEDQEIFEHPKDPYHRIDAEGTPVRNLLCFFNERVDIEVDGESQPRPETPWSRGAKEGEA